ncbi:MAG: hypothetical protein K0Q46_2713 [Rhodococcus erythropolis]|nr:hypothetical protein [Rhodococcus erythropolis]
MGAFDDHAAFYLSERGRGREEEFSACGGGVESFSEGTGCDAAFAAYVDGIDPYSDGYHRDLRIGRFDISYANVSSEGHAYFYDARDGLDIMDNAGWVYAPDGVSDETFNQPRLEDIGDGWYRFPR